MITDTKLLIFSLNAILFAFFLMQMAFFHRYGHFGFSYWNKPPAMAPARIKTQKKASQNGLLEIVAEARLERTTSRL